MPRINLLPWREQDRKVRRREFLVAAGAAVFASVILIIVGVYLRGPYWKIYLPGTPRPETPKVL